MTIEKYWNTWNPYAYTHMEHIPSGLTVIPGAFSEAEHSYSTFAFDDNMKLYEHDKDGRYCHFSAVHAYAGFEIEYLKPDPWTVLLRMRNVVPPREWGLRFHMLVNIGYRAEMGKMFLTSDGRLMGCGDEYHVAAAFLDEPYNITFAETEEETGERMADKGFKANIWEKKENGFWATGKFTLEAGPEVCLAVSIANDSEYAWKAAEKALTYFEYWDGLKKSILDTMPCSDSEDYPGMLEAVSDIMAWNDMYSPVIRRDYTSITKGWNESFGDWYLFFSDACYQVMLKSLAGDDIMAERNLDFVLSAATPAGNFCGMYSGYQKWVDRTQPPAMGFSILMSYFQTGNRTILEKAFPALVRASEWYLSHRDEFHAHMIQLGTNPIGNGDYRCTKVGAKNEAAMDNSPMYDEAVYRKESYMLDMYDVGISGLLALDLECAVRIAEILNRQEEAASLEKEMQKVKKAVHDKLWNDEEKIFANRHLDGRFGLTSPTSFYPLAAGIADEEQVEACIRHIFDPEEFLTECPLIAINAKDPSAKENKYWRGRTWAPQAFWTYVGLRRNGKDREAHMLAKAALKYFDRHWKNNRRAYENYNPFTGTGNDSVDSNGFYSWTALLPAMWVMEQLSVDPWDGISFGFPDGSDCLQKGRLIEGKKYGLSCKDGVTTVTVDGRIKFQSDIPARFKHFCMEPHYCSVTVNVPEYGYVEFSDATVLKMLVDGQESDISSKVYLETGSHCVECFCR